MYEIILFDVNLNKINHSLKAHERFHKHYSNIFVCRFRTWEAYGQLVAVSSHHGRDQLTVQLTEGSVCVQLVLHPHTHTHLCLPRVHLNDGRWHHIKANR